MVQRIPNIALRRVREVERQESRTEFADAMARVAERLRVSITPSERYVARLEDGDVRYPGPAYRRVLAELCQRPASELGFASPLARKYGSGEPEKAGQPSAERASVLLAHGESALDAAFSENSAWEVTELVGRLGHSEIGASAIELLQGTVSRLCCDYGREPADSLHAIVRGWISRITLALDKRTTLAQHRELLVCAGWLFLLGGCVEYDMGWRGAADASRIAALQIGQETSHGEIQAWAWEMAAWFALTQGNVSDVSSYVNAGHRAGGTHTVNVQLDGQLAKAAARMGEPSLVGNALESGYAKLSNSPRPDNPRHHFVVDPDKWDFYAMDAFRLLGDDVRASNHAKEVLRRGQGADGEEIAPMRMAEARLTLGVSAARAGELEEAVSVGSTAFDAERKSLPSLLMVAGELKSELATRYPSEPLVREYDERLKLVRRAASLELEQ